MLHERRFIELLSPAKNLECGKAAITHGADAVYIGAPQFSARKSAANTIDDIAELVRFAHLYGARVFVALNTILFDAEMAQAVDMAWQLYGIGVDALIVQDLGLLECELPPIELHASTQMDNRTPQKARFMQDVGFRQVVLARELSEKEIRAVADATQVRLEAFVHGALCVSYSGQCYMSQCINGRSANRGECGQPCRLAYTLTDAAGHVLERNRHLLSLKDFNQTRNIEALIDAGVSSLKIEGRLKDADYVANITLHYRKVVDEILSRRPDLRRASAGRVVPSFAPVPDKSFNRGFTTYFFNGRQSDIWQPASPKSWGEYLGRAAGCTATSFRIEGNPQVANGDGLCFVNSKGQFDGMNVNRVENGVIFPRRMNGLTNGTKVYRNADAAFEALLRNDSTRRVVDVEMRLSANGNVFSLAISDADGVMSLTERAIDCEAAKNIEASRGNMQRQMAKLGGTPLACEQPMVDDSAAALFVPSAELNALRRDAVLRHIEARIAHFAPADTPFVPTDVPYIAGSVGREANIVNSKAWAFYQRHGATPTEWGYERQSDYRGAIVMTTKHCIMHARGCCLKANPHLRKTLPLILESGKDRYELSFDCSICQMTVKRV